MSILRQWMFDKGLGHYTYGFKRNIYFNLKKIIIVKEFKGKFYF